MVEGDLGRHHGLYQVLLSQLDLLMIAEHPTQDQLEAIKRNRVQIVEIMQAQEVHVRGGDGDYVRGDKIGGDKAGGDIAKQQAGGDIVGSAAGRGAGAAVNIAVATFDDLRQTLSDVLTDVERADMPVRDKAHVMSALVWLSDHLDEATAPPDAGSRTEALKQAAGWVKERLVHIGTNASGALIGHWLISLLAGLHQQG